MQINTGGQYNLRKQSRKPEGGGYINWVVLNGEYGKAWNGFGLLMGMTA